MVRVPLRRCVEKWVSLGNLSSSFQLMPPSGCSDGEIVGIPPKSALTMFQHGMCWSIITVFIFIFDFLPLLSLCPAENVGFHTML